MAEVHNTVQLETVTMQQESVFELNERVTRPVRLPLQRIIGYSPHGEPDGAIDN